MPRTVLRALCCAAFLLTLYANAPARADVWGLVVGIDKYAHWADLEGAVADAKDIAGALREIGAREPLILLDVAATKGAILAAWRKLVAGAKPGDTILFSFAGHGSQLPELIAGDEADHMDEIFVLSGASDNPADPGQGNYIRDNEIRTMLAAAGAKGVQVLFLADSCHSGTMTRSADKRAPHSTRALPPFGLAGADPLEDRDGDGDWDDDGDRGKGGADGSDTPPVEAVTELDNVLFFSATTENKKSPEIVINGEKRGALSYAFARGLEGAADSNGDKVITRLELAGYVARLVHQLSESMQSPILVPRTRGDAPLFSGLKLAKPVDDGADFATLKMRFLHVSDTERAELLRGLTGIERAREGGPADLIWDKRDRTVLSGIGDPVALDVSSIRLQGVIDKWRALPALRRMVAARSLDISTYPDAKRHLLGSKVGFRSEALPYKFITAINLAPDGTVKLLIPFAGDPGVHVTGKIWEQKFSATEPPGSDHLIVIASQSRLDGLHRQLRAVSARRLAWLLHKVLRDVPHEIGMASLYTARDKVKR